MSERIIKTNEAITEATKQMMAVDQRIFVMGLGVSYKNGADGTTAGLKALYPDRVFDVPVSEAGFTAMAVGAAINGLKPVIHHGRVEFALLAADAIFTQAAKWNYMFGGGSPVPIVIRIAVGRAWGNGPQHTQALYSLFGNVPGLKVVIPSTAAMAKGLLVSALKEASPVIILESRWIYGMKQDVPENLYEVPLDKAHVFKKGDKVTLVAYGDGFVAALEAIEILREQGITNAVELVDLVSLNPIDHATIAVSLKKTGRLLCVDTTNGAFGIASEIIAKIAQNKDIKLTTTPASLSCPEVPCPTSSALTEGYYPTKVDIANAILNMLGKPPVDRKLSFEEYHTHPGFIVK